MNNNNSFLAKNLGKLISSALVLLLVGFSTTLQTNADNSKGGDSLYIGDNDQTGEPPGCPSIVRRFNASTGENLGEFVREDPLCGISPEGLRGPRGLIFPSPGNLYVVNQNVAGSFSGGVTSYNGNTGKFLREVVPATDDPAANPKAPNAPRGMVLWENRVLFVADEFAEVDRERGRLLAYNRGGKFLKELTPDPDIVPAGNFHPRAVVVGPDGYLYVSNVPRRTEGLTVSGGQVLRFNPRTMEFIDVVINDLGGVGQLNRPEGLVFSPDGHLYITSFRADTSDTDSIRIYEIQSPNFDGEKAICKTKIDLYGVKIDNNVPTPVPARAFAQALLFGPGGDLFVPITGAITIDPQLKEDPTGQVRRYDVSQLDNRPCNDVREDPSDNFTIFVEGGPLEERLLKSPYYLTFENTDPGTLVYKEKK